MSIYELCDRATDEVTAADPMFATFMGVDGHDDRWTDLSPDGFAARRQLWASLLDEATTISIDGPDETLARDVLVDELNLWIAQADAGQHRRDLNSIASALQGIRQIVDLMPKETPEQWGNLIVRLSTIDQAIDGYRASLAAGAAAGEHVALRQVDEAIRQARSNTADDAALLRMLDAHDESGGSPDQRAELAAALQHAQGVFGSFADWLEADYRPGASDADGVGEFRYREAARNWLGVADFDPAATYAWGWAELDRLWARLEELAPEIDPDATTEAVMERLATDPDMAANSLEEFLQVMRDRQAQALEQLSGEHFDVPEQIRTIDVKVDDSGGSLAPYYTPPSEDFSRSGTVWYPVEGRTFFPLFSEITTAYHEGFPGHHLQVGVQFSLADTLSRFHRLVVWYPGSGEGWALYAEHLMGELGYLEKPEYEIGLLVSKLLRASRIVIDIGVHCGYPIPDDAWFHPGSEWTHELAVELLKIRGFLDDEVADSEATRYFGWPGQAISYKVGEQAILDLREEARAHPDWDPKRWHNDLLSAGSIGLDLLRSHMRARW